MVKKRSERQAPPALELFRLMVENTGEEVYLVHPDGKFAFVNHAAAESLGYTVEEMLALGVQGIDSSSTPEGFRRFFEAVKKGHEGLFETVNLGKDGRGRVKEIKPVYAEFEGQEFVLGLGRDITERHASEKVLRESERRFRTLIESLPGLAVQCLDRTGTIRYWNEASERLYGYTSEEACGRSFNELLVLPEQRPDLLKAYHRWIEGGPGIGDGELDLLHKDGHAVHIYTNRVRLKGSLGEDEIYRVDIDLSARVRAEEELRHQDERFRHFVENLQDVVLLLNPDGIIQYASPSLERVLGRSVKARLGRSAFEFIHPEDASKVRAFAELWLTQTGPIPAFSLRLRHNDGTYRNFEAVGVNLLDDPAVAGIVITLRDVTERVYSEAELRAASARSEYERAKSDAILASMGDGISMQDPEMRVLYQNESHRRVIGDQVGKFCYQAYECRESICEGCPIARSFADGGIHTMARSTVLPGGEALDVEITASSVRDAEGHVVCGIEVVRDVTKRNRVERALADSERTYRMLYERNMGGVYRSSLDGRVLHCNLAFARILGCASVEEVQALSASSFYADPEGRLSFLEEIQSEGAVSNYRESLRAKDGRSVTILLNANLIREGEGDPYIEGTLIDITELEQATEALVESEARLKDIIEHSTNLFYSHTPEHILTYVSPQSRALLDCEPEEALVLWTELVTDNPINTLGYEATQRAIDTGERQPPYELELVGRKGRVIWVEVNEAPIVRAGKTEAIVGALTDITARKRAEAETAGLQTRLQQSQKLESLGILAGGISHDFSNLLVGMLGNADLALMDPSLSSPARHRLEEVRMAAIRASELTSHMLAYSGQGQVTVKPVDLNALVEEMAVLMEASISRKAVLRYSFAKGLPAVEGDVVQLRQVAMNLILNASESFWEKSGIIQIGTSLEQMTRADLEQTLLGAGLAPGPFVSLVVSDTGCGMNAETRERIFDPFYTTKKSGRGLGLAVVLGIVRSHRGTLRVFSEPGRGSRFEVCFPASAAAAEPTSREEGDAGTVAEPGAGAVLLVDDDAGVREVATAMLEGLGYKVIQASSGKEALERAASPGARLDAVLLDLSLGEMDGDEVLKVLRAKMPTLPVILLTGRSPREVEHRMEGLVVDGVLRKPFRRADLVKALRAVTRR